MPRRTKNQIIRDDTMRYLEDIKGKLNPRTYTSFRNDIKDKRIDAVKRLSDKLKILQYTTKENITKTTLKSAVEDAERQNRIRISKEAFDKKIKKESTIILEPDVKKIYLKVMELILMGVENLRIILIDDGKVKKYLDIEEYETGLFRKTDAKRKIDGSDENDIYSGIGRTQIYSMILFAFFYPENLVTKESKIIITQEEMDISPERIAQVFKQGTTNCLFLPIIKWCKNKIITSYNNLTKKKYISKLNVVEKMEQQYRDSGVSEENLQGICDKLQINIKIRLPFQTIDPIIETKCNKKHLTTFEYINTKIDHVDGFTHNEIVNKKPLELSCDDMEKLYNDLVTKKEYFLFKRTNNSGISSISTIDSTFILKQDFNEFTNEFKKITGLNNCKICDFEQYNLSQYIRCSNSSNLTIDFKNNPNNNFIDATPPESVTYDEFCPLNFIPEYTPSNTHPLDYNHMDMEKAYKNVDKCKYYKGYLGKITDFRKTDRIEGIGIYTITNLILPEKLREYNDKMLIWSDGNPYPSPELEFLKEHNATFDIIEGCWGTHIDFNFDDPKWLNTVDDGCGNGKKARWYTKFVGCMEIYSEHECYHMNADKKYIQNLISYLPRNKYRIYDNEVIFLDKKDSNNHLSHISSFIKSYTRINMMEQLMSMKIDDIIRVCVDGIYYYNNYPCLNIFRDEPKEIKENFPSNSYTCNYNHNFKWTCQSEYKPFHKTELHTGCGGGGKTHKQLIDTGNVKMLYCSPSWKLARNKQKEYKTQVEVWYNILTNDPAIYSKIIKKYNVLIIDEISMLNNTLKEKIFKRYSNMKIIMCGDPNYQLDGFNDNCNNIEYIPFKCEGFEHYEEHNTNYRVKDEKLLLLLNEIRKMIKEGNHHQVKNYTINNFTKVKKIDNYNVKDMILTRTNIGKDKYTELFDNYEKYIITNNTLNYSNGEIVYSIPTEPGVTYKKRHAFTTHSIQGETATNNIYICIDDMYSEKMIYTALSRAKYYNQIYLLTES